MVGKWSCRNPLTFDQRKLIKEGLDMNMSYREISKHVGRNKSVVMREAKRLGDIYKYDPEKAQENFEMIQKKRRKNQTGK